MAQIDEFGLIRWAAYHPVIEFINGRIRGPIHYGVPYLSDPKGSTVRGLLMPPYQKGMN